MNALGLAIMLAAQAFPLPPVEGTVALFSMEEGSGLTTADLSGNGYHARIQLDHEEVEEDVWTEGFLSLHSLTFREPYSKLRFDSPSIPIPMGSTWTIQAWTKFPLAGSGSGWNSLTTSFTGFFPSHVEVDSTGELGVIDAGLAFHGSGFGISNLDGWHLLSAVGAGNQTSFYVDGEFVGAADTVVTGPIHLVGNYADEAWGTIDSLRILNRVRTPAEIAADAAISAAPPPVPQMLSQFTTAGTPIAEAGAAGSALDLRATVASSYGRTAALEIEVKPLNDMFSASGTLFSDPVPAGTATIRVSGLSYGAYHWRARTIDSYSSLRSDWSPGEVTFVVPNTAPSAAAPVQRNGDGTVIVRGGHVDDYGGVRFDVTAGDSDGDAVFLEIEIRSAGETFTGSATHRGDLSRAASLSCVASVTPGSYRWAYRVVDAAGAASAWTVFGGPVDFVVLNSGSHGTASCLSSAAGGRAGLLALLLLPLVTRRARGLVILLAASTPAMAQHALEVVPGTEALYQFDERDVSYPADSSGRGHTGLLVGAQWTDGYFSPYAIDGGMLEVYSSVIPMGPTWTIQAWTRFPLPVIEGGSYRTLTYYYRNGQPMMSHVCVHKNGYLGATDASERFISSGTSVESLTGWHLVSAVAANGRTTFFIDDQPAGFIASVMTEQISTIGNWYYGARPWGTIDSIRVLTGVARTAAEIAVDAHPVAQRPAAPTSLAQFDVNGNPIPAGGDVALRIFDAKARATTPYGRPARLQVEVKRAGAGFDETGIHETTVPTGTTGTLRIDDVVSGGYHWRARTIDTYTNLDSPWVNFGGGGADLAFPNSAPTLSSLEQRRVDAIDALAKGAQVDDAQGLQFEASASDANDDAIRLEIELRPPGGSFTGTPTLSGEAVRGTRPGCRAEIPPGAYVWRARVVDEAGAASAWMSFSGDASRPDFVYTRRGSQGSASCLGASGGAHAISLLLVLGLLCLSGGKS